MSRLIQDQNFRTLQLTQPAATHKQVAVSTVSAQSSAMESTTTIAELYCASDCFVALGINPVATTNGIPLYAGIPRTVQVQPGSKVAGIVESDTATLRIVEML